MYLEVNQLEDDGISMFYSSTVRQAH